MLVKTPNNEWIEQKGFSVPGTKQQLGVVQWDKKDFSVTHRPSGAAIMYTSSKAMGIAVGKAIWENVSQEVRQFLTNNPDLPMQSKDPLYRQLGPVIIQIRHHAFYANSVAEFEARVGKEFSQE